MIQISEHIFATMHDDANDQPYVYLIHGSSWNLQIDTGNSPRNYHLFLQEIEQAGFDKPKLIGLTHWHWDHTFDMMEAEVPVMASAKTDAYLRKICRWQWTEEAMRERLRTGEEISFCDEKMHVEYADVTSIRVRHADIILPADTVFDLGDVTVRAIQADSPHTRDAIFWLVEEDETLIAGDGEYEDYYDNGGHYDPKRLSAYIRFLENLSFKRYARSHDEAWTTKENILKKLEQAMRQCERDK